MDKYKTFGLITCFYDNETKNYECPSCNYINKERSEIHRHYENIHNWTKEKIKEIERIYKESI